MCGVVMQTGDYLVRLAVTQTNCSEQESEAVDLARRTAPFQKPTSQCAHRPVGHITALLYLRRAAGWNLGIKFDCVRFEIFTALIMKCVPPSGM
jgi:hypothetical protein